METVEIYLNTDSPDFKSLRNEIGRYLDTLETVTYNQEKRRPPEGTLSAPDAETISYFVMIAANIAQFVAAIVLIYQQIAGETTQESEAKPSPDTIVLRIKDLELSLPSTKRATSRFIEDIGSRFRGSDSGDVAE